MIRRPLAPAGWLNPTRDSPRPASRRGPMVAARGAIGHRPRCGLAGTAEPARGLTAGQVDLGRGNLRKTKPSGRRSRREDEALRKTKPSRYQVPARALRLPKGPVLPVRFDMAPAKGRPLKEKAAETACTSGQFVENARAAASELRATFPVFSIRAAHPVYRAACGIIHAWKEGIVG